MFTLGIFVIIMILPERLRMILILFIIVFSFSVASILPPSLWLPGHITLENFLYIYFIIYGYKNGFFKKSGLTVFGKIALSLALVFWLIQPLYISIKDFFVFDKDLQGPLISLIKSVLKILIVVALISYATRSQKNYILLMRLIFYSAAIYCLSSLFSGIFTSLGYHIEAEIEVTDKLARMEGITRMSVNPFGALMVITLGVLFNFFLLKNIRLWEFLMLSGLLVIGILLTGSRTAFIALLIVGLLFFTDKRLNLKKNTLYGFLVMLIMVVLLFFKYGDTVINRVKMGEEQVGYGGLGTRMNYWEMYMNDMAENPHYWIMGNTEHSTYKRSAHNYYVMVLFSSGMIFILLLFMLAYKLIKQYRVLKKTFKIMGLRNPAYTNVYFILVPQLLYWIPGVYPIFWWSLIFLGTVYIPQGFISITTSDESTGSIMNNLKPRILT
jgi:hypothetical protein